jgi:hypothetical protein
VSVFRAQLLLEEQRRLYDVWLAAAGCMDMPTRETFQPRAFGPLLPFISLIDLSPEAVPRVRVAGSSLREVFCEDPRTCLLRADEPGAGDTIKRVIAERKPVCGVAPRNHTFKPVRFWLRLPLGCGVEVTSVIGLDIAISGARAPQWAMEQMQIA